MKNNQTQKNYTSPILMDILSNISNDEFDATEEKMKLAVKIAEAIKTKGYTKKSDFAKKLGKQNSEISKWLSGTHNFTTETLILLQNELDIVLINSQIIDKVELKNIHIETKTTSKAVSNEGFNFNVFKIFNFPKADFTNSYTFCVK